MEPNNDIGLNLDIDDTYEYLTGIFPNADPHYLRSTAEKFKNENDVETFVEDKLQSNDYPTRDQYLAKIKVTEEQQRYTVNFNVEQFLIQFPNPIKHFENETRKCQFSITALEFLKSQFNRLKFQTINLSYARRYYNMSLSAKELRLSTDFISKPRNPREIPTGDILLLQEMAFVRHHAEITKHVEAIKQREEEEYNSLKATGGLWTCECCYDDECLPSKCSTCDNAHVFCNSCIVKGTDVKLGEGEAHVPCFLNCASEFSISTLKKVLPPAKFNILIKKQQELDVIAARVEGLVSCPFCHFASIPPEGAKVFKCLAPECMKESCIQCKQLNHVPLKCVEVKQTDARKYIEEKMTQALTRTCYKCKKVFFQEEGCNKMTCVCGAQMCYICNKPVKDYKHFRTLDSNNFNKCPLWSNNRLLNAEAVRAVEEDMRRQILQQDQTLHNDTSRLTPALPPPTPGLHSTIPEDNNIADIIAPRQLHAHHFNLQNQMNRNGNLAAQGLHTQQLNLQNQINQNPAAQGLHAQPLDLQNQINQNQNLAAQRLHAQPLDLQNQMNQNQNLAAQRLHAQPLDLQNQMNQNQNRAAQRLHAQPLDLQNQMNLNQNRAAQRLHAQPLDLQNQMNQNQNRAAQRLHAQPLDLQNQMNQNQNRAAQRLHAQLLDLQNQMNQNQNRADQQLHAQPLDLQNQMNQNQNRAAQRLHAHQSNLQNQINQNPATQQLHAQPLDLQNQMNQNQNRAAQRLHAHQLNLQNQLNQNQNPAAERLHAQPLDLQNQINRILAAQRLHAHQLNLQNQLNRNQNPPAQQLHAHPLDLQNQINRILAAQELHAHQLNIQNQMNLNQNPAAQGLHAHQLNLQNQMNQNRKRRHDWE